MRAVKFLNASLLATALFGLPAVGVSNMAYAQTTTSGDIAGTVTDPSGAVVPNAPVTVKNDATGQTINITTNNSGYYRASSLLPGSYSITVNAAGFSAGNGRAAVAVGQATTVNIGLTTAAASTTVEVTSEAPVIQTENANISTSYGTRDIELLPNPGGDQTYIAQTAPGVVQNNSGGFGNFEAFGLPATSNLFTLNGNDNMDPFLNLNTSGATNLLLGTNEVAEVTVVNNGYSANFGRQAGSQVNSVTKSGTNDFHGNAIYWWNGRSMNANNWFNKNVDTTAGGTVTPRGFVNANQWAASLGGPVVKDKTFFFVDTEGLRVVIPTSVKTFVPTPQFQSFILGSGLAGAGNAAEVPFYQNIFNIYNNAPGAAAATNAGPGSGCTSAVSGLPGFPAGIACTSSFQAEEGNQTNEWMLSGRVDQILGSNDRMFVRYRQDKGLQATYTDPLNPVFNAFSRQPQYDGQLNENHTFGTKAVNQFILSGSYYRAIFDVNNPAAALAAFPTQLSISGLRRVGGDAASFPQGRTTTQYQVVDDLTINKGSHTLKIGANYRRNDVTDFSQGIESNGFASATLAGFATGVADNFFQQVFPSSGIEVPIALWSAGFYGEDDWRATNNLKLTLSFRIDHNSNPVCQTNCFSRLSGPFETVNHDPNQPYNQVIQTGLHQAFPNTTSVLYQPRIGFAWTPMGHSGTVLRGGFGLFNDLFPATLIDSFLVNAPQSITLTTAGNPIAPGVPNNGFAQGAAGAAAFQQQFANGGTAASIAASVPGFTGFDYNTVVNTFKTPTFQEWNLELQQAVGSKSAVSINYVGNHGYHIPLTNNWTNAFCPAGTCAGQAGLLPVDAPPDQRFGNVNELTNGGFSHYNGITGTFQRKFTSGFQMQASYTFSHATDNVSNGGVLPFFGTGSVLNLLNPLNPQQNYGNADYDVRHNFTANYLYEVPFKFGNSFVNEILGGWIVGGTFFWHSGYPFSVIDSSAPGLLGNASNASYLAPFAAGVNYSNTCSNGPAVNVNTGTNCLNFGNFASVDNGAPVTFSDQRRNQFRGPGYFNTDLSVSKNFKLTERFRLAVGANAFNVLNHPNFANPVSDVAAGAGQFGQIQSTVNPPTSPLGAFLGADASARIVQLQAKITF